MRRLLPIVSCLLATQPAVSQSQSAPSLPTNAESNGEQPLQKSQLSPTQSGRVADSSVGQVGQRQTGNQVVSGFKPMARLANRIENRVRSRIRNRIDRDYDPRADAASPFVEAEGQARIAGRPNR